MKNKLITVVLILAMIFSMTACGSSGGSGSAQSDEGDVYYCTSVEMMGVTMNATEAFDGVVILELKDEGKGILTMDGESGDITWELKGEDFSMTIDQDEEKIVSAGTMKDNVIVIDLLSAGLQCTFEQLSDEQIKELEAEADTASEEAAETETSDNQESSAQEKTE